MQMNPAFQFVNSVGVCTHFAWETSPYRIQYAKAKAALTELGIRHIRDRAGNTQCMAAFRDLYDSLKLRMALTVDRRTGRDADARLNPSDISDELARLRTELGAQALSAIEGPNEYNLLERDHGYMDWPQELRTYQTELFRQVNADSELSSRSVVAPSMGGPNLPYYYGRLGDYSAIADGGSAHIYPNWLSMSEKVAEILPSVKLATPKKRIWLTESGWHGAINSGAQFVPEDIMVRYLPRAMAEFSTNPDIKRGYFYELIDVFDDPAKTKMAAHFGLLDYNLNKKPSFYAVRNMMHILSDNLSTTTPASLDYTLSGNLTDVHSHLFYKQNGTFDLLIWLEKRLYNRFGPVLNVPQAVTVQFGQPISLVRRYVPSDPNSDLTAGNRPKQTYKAPTKIDLNVPDHIVVLEIVPSGVVTPPVSTSCNFVPSL
jgi:hypothetical protein